MSDKNKNYPKNKMSPLTKAGNKVADAAEKGVRAGASAALDLVVGVVQAVLAPPKRR